jgi:magnesium-transporting ATPase (P-type)
LLSNPAVIAGSLIMIACQVLFVNMPLMNTLFNTAPIGMYSWLHIAVFGCVIFIVIEIEKYVRARFSAR